MPTNRPLHDMPALVLATEAAEALDAQLVLLRSGAACRYPFPALLAPRTSHPTAVIDLPSPLPPVLPTLATGSSVVGTLHRQNDVAWKRNVAQLLAVLCGWDLLLLLDDDMRGTPTPREGVAGFTLDLRAEDVVREFLANPQLQAVGYSAAEFPDHSVLGHIERRLERRFNVFLGGTIWTRVGPDMPFFAPAYNEDWLWFLAHILQARPETPTRTVMSAGHLFQTPYNPFTPQRARAEELGDVLAEGLFDLLAAQPQAVPQAAACDVSVWERAVRRRQRSLAVALQEVMDCYCTQHQDQRDASALEALIAAIAVYHRRDTRAWSIELTHFVADWLSDLSTWREFVLTAKPAADLDLAAALAEVQLAANVTWVFRSSDKLRLVVGTAS